jgi:DNA-binding transcriptional MerR regulator
MMLEVSRLLFDDEFAPLFTMGQVSGMLGVQPAFLRRLDSENVVQPARSDGGQRRYSRQEVRDVERIVTLTGEGLTLAGVRRILILEAEIAVLNARILELEASQPDTDESR